MTEVKAKDEAMLANIGDGLVFTDLTERVVLMNKAAERMLGWNQEESVGKEWEIIVRSNDGAGKKIPSDARPLTRVLTSRDTTTTTTTIDAY